jgi:hypothetical protein
VLVLLKIVEDPCVSKKYVVVFGRGNFMAISYMKSEHVHVLLPAVSVDTVAAIYLPC